MESFNSETKELRATNQDMQTYIDSCNKERAAYTEHKNLHFKNIADITVDSYIINPHKKKNGREEDFQEDSQIPLNENEGNYSIIAIGTIEPKASEKIE